MHFNGLVINLKYQRINYIKVKSLQDQMLYKNLRKHKIKIMKKPKENQLVAEKQQSGEINLE